MQTQPAPGTRVRLTGAFLRSTGQIAGGEGTRVWTVAACGCGLCAFGDFVAVNERSMFGDPDAANNLRHMNYKNLEPAPGRP